MKKAEIVQGGLYLVKMSGVVTTVRVDAIRQGNELNRDGMAYDVTNLATGRKTTFRSAAKFRGPAKRAEQLLGRLESKTKGGLIDPMSQTENENIREEGRAEIAARQDNTIVEDEQSCPFVEPTASMDAIVIPTFTEDEKRSDPMIHSTIGSGQMTAIPVAVYGNGLAGRIAAARRAIGTPVAGMVPNAEQESILAVAEQTGLKVLVINAGAGTGKTSTLKMLEQVLPGRGQYTAFNTSLVNESKAKFTKASCNTTHSLAFRAVGKTYQHRLGGERMRSGQMARILGVEALPVKISEVEVNGKMEPKFKTLQAEFLAGQVMVAIKKFCQSADDEVQANHFGYIDGIDIPSESGKRGYTNNNRVREYLLPFAHKAWADLSRIDGQLPFSHDVYVKLWSMGRGDDKPIIPTDYILLDEHQDTAEVFLHILKQQTHALLILVGDDCQRIYEWRGAVNAGDAFPNAPRRLLSQSYRFGQAIADVANAVLGTLDEPTDLVMKGNPATPSRVAEVESPRCYLYRTNAGAVSRVMIAIQDKKRPHLIGGGADVVAWCQAAVDLQAKRGTRHPELCCFDTWGEVVEYSKTDEGSDLKLMVKLVEEFGAANIRDALKDMPKEQDADLVVSTAHRSKGREWDTVKLGPDFPTSNRMNDADRRLLYVAATRAKLTLDITACPPFCGGKDKTTGEAVGGIKIVYTSPMPTEDEQRQSLANPVAVPVEVGPGAESTPQTSLATPRNGQNAYGAGNGAGRYTWCKWDDAWCVRGPKDAKVGDKINVERKDGSGQEKTVRRVVKQLNDAWIYGV